MENNSFQYCTQCGQHLISQSELPTIPDDGTADTLRLPVDRIPTDLAQQQQFLFEDLYELYYFKEFEFDARFHRLLSRLKAEGFDLYMGFLIRLVGRAKLLDSRHSSEGLSELIHRAIDLSDSESDDLLRSSGLL